MLRILYFTVLQRYPEVRVVCIDRENLGILVFVGVDMKVRTGVIA